MLALCSSIAMVEVFKTDVNNPEQATELINLLSKHFPDCQINFDLEDCDKVLRVEGPLPETNQVIDLLKRQGVQCCVLD